MIDEARLISALNELVAHLSRLRRPVVELLQPGLSNADIAQLDATLPFRLTDELKTIYRWRNGTPVKEGNLLGDLWFFPGFYFPALEHARRSYEERKDAKQWRKGWWPLFEDGAGDFYNVPCKKLTTDRAPVIGFLHGEPEALVEYLDVTTMIETLVDCYAQGVFFVTPDGRLEMDDDRHEEIARQHNPGVYAWES